MEKVRYTARIKYSYTDTLYKYSIGEFMNNIIAKSLNSKEHTVKRRKRSELLKKFGINFDQYNEMLVEQNYVCAICKREDACGRDLAVDHCHITKKVRGLLCTNCNTALGGFQDNADIVKNALEYVTRDYKVPAVSDSIKKIGHNDRPNWKMIVTTPDGVFPSLKHAGDHYKVDHTTIRRWCLDSSKQKRDGFSCQKIFISLNQLKEHIDGKN